MLTFLDKLVDVLDHTARWVSGRPWPLRLILFLVGLPFVWLLGVVFVTGLFWMDCTETPEARALKEFRSEFP